MHTHDTKRLSRQHTPDAKEHFVRSGNGHANCRLERTATEVAVHEVAQIAALESYHLNDTNNGASPILMVHIDDSQSS